MAAQAIIESAYGQSSLSAEYNNLFGIKGSYNGASVGLPTGEYRNGRYETVIADFRVYPTVLQSLEDNAKLLRNGLSYNSNFYSGTWRENTSSFIDAANFLQGRYATSPTYAQTLINTIRNLNLERFD